MIENEATFSFIIEILLSIYMHVTSPRQNGFTLIELIIVIVILGILAVVAAPRFIDISSSAKVAVMENVAGQIRSTVEMAKVKARLSGLTPSTSNPRNAQSNYIVDFGFGRAEVDWRNLCPESRAELGDAMDLLDFLDVSFNDQISSRFNNQYTLIGFDVPASGTPTTEGCYIIYDSFGAPDCTVTIVEVDC